MVLKMLELFSGTCSVGKIACDLGFEVVSLDLKMEATIKTDIMDWDFQSVQTGSFDFIWASPPCTEYSRAKTTGIRKIDEANEIVKRTIEIIEHFKPRFWVIENPQTGLLKNQEFMFDLPYKDVDYCKYGMQYRKRTRLWNNITTWKPKPLCNKDCESMNGNKHISVAQRVGELQPDGTRQKFKQCELYVIPGRLIHDILISLE